MTWSELMADAVGGLTEVPSCMLAAPTREPCPNPGIGSPPRHNCARWLQTC
jgi:hypothetical protein